MDYYRDLEFDIEHRHQADKLAKETLKRVANRLRLPYGQTSDLFREGDDEVTAEFWKVLYLNPLHQMRYNRIYYCYGCKKFNMYFEE